MLNHRRRAPAASLPLLPALLIVGVVGCNSVFDPPRTDPGGHQAPELEPPTRPENLIENLQTIYNDKVRNAAERLSLYRDLFPPDSDEELPHFIFIFQPADLDPGEQPWWGLDQELQSHENIFKAQEQHQIFSLELTITHQPAEDLELPQPGREDWKSIQATNVNLRLMFNPQDGLEVNGGQALFLLVPDHGRWYIAEWKDLPRP